MATTHITPAQNALLISLLTGHEPAADHDPADVATLLRVNLIKPFAPATGGPAIMLTRAGFYWAEVKVAQYAEAMDVTNHAASEAMAARIDASAIRIGLDTSEAR